MSDYNALFIYDYAFQALQQDMLTNYIFTGSQVGRTLRDMVLWRNSALQPLTNPTEEALTGTMRADSAAIRQNARNVGEAASMMGIAKTAVEQINSALGDMEDIIEGINAGELDAGSSLVQADYDALKSKISGLISDTDFNSIYMLDSSQWGTQQIDSSGNVWIQAYKNGGFDVTFVPVDTMDWSDLDSAELDTDINNQKSVVDSLQLEIEAVLDRYTAKESSLDYQEARLSSQADILDQAVASRMPSSAGRRLEQLLLDYLLESTGGIVDEST